MGEVAFFLPFFCLILWSGKLLKINMRRSSLKCFKISLSF